MNLRITAIVLIVIGVIILAYSGITFKTPGEPIHIFGTSIATTHSHFIPPVVGTIAVICGIACLLIKPSKLQ
jgi:hypothetical protein